MYPYNGQENYNNIIVRVVVNYYRRVLCVLYLALVWWEGKRLERRDVDTYKRHTCTRHLGNDEGEKNIEKRTKKR